MYYNLLKKIVKMFNLQRLNFLSIVTGSHSDFPKLNVCTKRRNFETIINLNRWFLVAGEWLGEKENVEVFLETIRKFNFPFIAIVNDDGIWFVDLSRNYNAILNQKDFLYDIEKAETKDGLLVYNYPVFGTPRFKLKETIIISETYLKFLPPVDYLLILKSLWSYTDFGGKLEIGVSAEIYPENFIFNGIFLIHQSYDNKDKITLRFLEEILKITGMITKVFNEEIDVEFPKPISYKLELLDWIERKIIVPKCKKIKCIEYKLLHKHRNIELRLNGIKRFLQNIEQKN